MAKTRAAKIKNFLLITHPGEVEVEHFETEQALCAAYTTAVCRGFVAEAYEVREIQLELTAKRKEG